MFRINMRFTPCNPFALRWTAALLYLMKWGSLTQLLVVWSPPESSPEYASPLRKSLRIQRADVDRLSVEK